MTQCNMYLPAFKDQIIFVIIVMVYVWLFWMEILFPSTGF